MSGETGEHINRLESMLATKERECLIGNEDVKRQLDEIQNLRLILK